ncbi:hypothetical protein [Streptomyces sp. NPDC048057]|uniref:hypothetical protein n=1 Tax=Streptomyces sp. NPDC048057 TaxID=3155628 RepID=UPI0033E859AC
MRNRLCTRAAAPAVGATLTLTALVAPGTQAAASPVPPPPTTVDGYASNSRFVVGTTAPKTVTATFWATDPLLVKRLGARLFQGTSPADAQRWWHPTKTTCTGSATRKHCTAAFAFNWNTRRYVGYGGQQVHLAFRRTDDPYHVGLATRTTDRRGNVKVALRAYRDGSFRYDFHGTPGVRYAASTPDFVDVR